MQAKKTHEEIVEVADHLHSAAIHLLRRLRVRDRESGIGPSQLSALSVLVFGGPRSLRELADAEQVRPPTMSRIVVGLEKTGLILRQTTDDKRRMRLKPTAKGRKILQEGRRRRVESLTRALKSIDADELKQLDKATKLLERLVRKL